MRATSFLLTLSFAVGSYACMGDASDAPTHRIELQPVVTLSGVGDSIDLGIRMPAVAASGLIVVPIEFPPSGAVGVFDSTGRFVRRIGRSGGGPGEFRSVRFARANTGRLTPFGILSAGVYTSNGPVPPHLVDWDGTLLREYGADEPTADIHDRLPPPGLRDSAHVWVPYANAYVLELLGADGKVHQRIQRRVPWFPADSGARASGWPDRPPPRIHAVNVGSDGLLWVLIRRGHRDWTPTAPAPRSTGPVEARRLMANNLAEVFEGVLEVLDPRDGRLVASLEVSGGVLGFPAGDLLYEVQQDDVGRVSMRLWRLALRPF